MDQLVFTWAPIGSYAVGALAFLLSSHRSRVPDRIWALGLTLFIAATVAFTWWPVPADWSSRQFQLFKVGETLILATCFESAGLFQIGPPGVASLVSVSPWVLLILWVPDGFKDWGAPHFHVLSFSQIALCLSGVASLAARPTRLLDAPSFWIVAPMLLEACITLVIYLWTARLKTSEHYYDFHRFRALSDGVLYLITAYSFKCPSPTPKSC